MDRSSGNHYFSGTSGLLLPFAKHSFPEEFQSSSRLHFYSSLYNSIEFNSTFYKLPKAETVAKWSSDVREDFRLTFKLWKQITHNKQLKFQQEDVRTFFSTIAQAGEKKGAILVQFPPSIKFNYFNEWIELLEVMQECNPDHSWKVAIEFRDTSWYCEDVYELLQKFKMTLVLHDKGKSATPFIDFAFDFMYLRFHGPEGNYRGTYSEDFLYEYAGYIKAWLQEDKKVFVYFNNTMGDALRNLQTLNQLVLSKE